MYMSRGRPSLSGAGHPFARVFGHGAVRGQHAGSIKTAAPPYFRGPDNHPAARVLRQRCSRRRPLVGQGPDVPIAQPVVDEVSSLRAGRSWRCSCRGGPRCVCGRAEQHHRRRVRWRLHVSRLRVRLFRYQLTFRVALECSRQPARSPRRGSLHVAQGLGGR